MVGIRVVSTVVLNVESDTGRGEPEQDGQRHALPPSVGREHEQQVRNSQTGDEDRRLQVHLPAVASPPAGGPEELVDSPPKLELEGVIRSELESSSRHSHA